MTPVLANVVRSSSVGDDFDEPDLYVMNSSHPIMNGPYGQFPAGYHISDLFRDNDAIEADTARNASTIAELADGKDKIIATESLPGKGCLLERRRCQRLVLQRRLHCHAEEHANLVR